MDRSHFSKPYYMQLKAKNRRRIARFFTAITLFIVVFAVLLIKAGASHNNIASNVFPNPASSSPSPLYMTVGYGEYDLGLAAAIIAVPTTGTYSMTIEDAHHCGVQSAYTYQSLDLPASTSFAVPYFSTQFNVLSRTLGAARMTPVNTGLTANCINRDITVNFTVAAADYDSRIGAYTVVFTGNKGTPNPAYGGAVPGAAVNAFRIRINGSHIYPVVEPIFGPNSFFNLSNRNRPSGQVIDYTIDLAIACTASVNTVNMNISFYDIDNGQYQNVPGVYPTLDYEIQRAPRGTTAYSTVVPRTPMLGGSTGDGGTYTISGGLTLDKAYTYRLRVLGLSRPNAITYNATATNVGALFASDNCAQPNQMSCNNFTNLTGAPNTYIQVNFTIRNASSVNWVPGGTSSNPNFDIGVVDITQFPAIATANGSQVALPSAGGIGPPDHLSGGYRTTAGGAWISQDVRPGQNGTNGVYHRVTYDRSASDGSVEDSVGRYGTSATIGANGGTQSFSVWVLVPASGSKDYGIRLLDRQRLVSPDFWMDWSSSCQFRVAAQVDVCTNIAGMQTVVPNGYVQSGTSCILPAPTCALRTYSPAVGTNFTMVATIQNNSTATLSVISVTYSGQVSGSATAANIAGGSPRNFTSETERINTLGTYNITWTINYGTLYGNQSRSLVCTQVTTTPTGPTCVANTSAQRIGSVFRVSVTITNQMPVTLGITGSRWSVPQSNPPSGSGFRLSTGTAINTTTGGGFNIPSTIGAQRTVESDQVVRIDLPGDYGLSWEVDWSAGGYTGTINCNNPNGITVRQYPYARFYGNDIIAGGQYGATCSITSTGDVRGFGTFFNNTPTHANYMGAAAELAIFAAGQIDNVLPGSQVTTPARRPTLQTLSFANTSLTVSGVPTLPLGGNFGQPLCADSFPSIPAGAITGGNLDTLTGASGFYYRASATDDRQLTIGESAASSIAAGNKVTVYVEGDVTIKNNIAYNTAGWGSIDLIPLVRIYATGNIYIRGNVTQLDGLYAAEGQIYTCVKDGTEAQAAAGTTIYNIATEGAAMISACNNKLTVTGAFIAQKVNLLRINGSVDLATERPETAGSANIAETFQFSPELYLALLSLGSATNSTDLDSILSLPPAF